MLQDPVVELEVLVPEPDEAFWVEHLELGEECEVLHDQRRPGVDVDVVDGHVADQLNRQKERPNETNRTLQQDLEEKLA